MTVVTAGVASAMAVTAEGGSEREAAAGHRRASAATVAADWAAPAGPRAEVGRGEKEERVGEASSPGTGPSGAPSPWPQLILFRA